MATRTQQPDTPVLNQPPQRRRGRSFRVDRYELGMDIPLEKRFAIVTLTRDEEGVRADVRDEQYRWTVRLAKGEIVERWRKEVSGDAREELVELPRWVHVVLDYVGVRA